MGILQLHLALIASYYVAEERMVRHYKRKVETREAYGDEALREALTRVRQGEPLLRVSKDLGISARTIRRKGEEPWRCSDGCKVNLVKRRRTEDFRTRSGNGEIHVWSHPDASTPPCIRHG